MKTNFHFLSHSIGPFSQGFHKKHAHHSCEGLDDWIFNFIQNPMSPLCTRSLSFWATLYFHMNHVTNLWLKIQAATHVLLCHVSSFFLSRGKIEHDVVKWFNLGKPAWLSHIFCFTRSCCQGKRNLSSSFGTVVFVIQCMQV